MGVKDRGRPAKAGDSELVLFAEARADAPEKGKLANGAEADAKASLGALGVAQGVESPCGAAVAAGSPENAAGSGVEGAQ